MEYIDRKMVLMNLFVGEEWRADIDNSFVDTAGECEDGVNGRRGWDEWKWKR